MISILIPAFNVAPYIGACLESVLNGSGQQEIEVVVCVDARSTDATASIIREYALRDSRLRVADEGIRGVGRLRNRAIELARGSLLMFVDADDLLTPDAVDALYEGMTDDVDAVFGRMGRRRGAASLALRRMGGEDAAELMLYQCHLKEGLHCSVWAKLWRTAVWRTMRFPEDIIYEDLAVVPLVTARCRTVAVVDADVYYYRRRTGSILHTFSSQRFTSVQAAALLTAQAPDARFARAARNRQLSAAFNILRLMARHRRLMTPSLRRLGKATALPVIRELRGETLVNPYSRLRLRIASLFSYLFF